MAHGRKSHPETDASGDTIEFAAIELEQPERDCYEISNGTAVRVSPHFDGPIEIRVGQTTETSPLFLHHGYEFPDLLSEAEAAPGVYSYVLMQPDVMAEDPERGWLVITDWRGIGRSETPQFRLGPDISRKFHIMLGPFLSPGRAEWQLEVLGSSKNPTKVLVPHKPHPFKTYELGE
jgi:hypothetical protein